MKGGPLGQMHRGPAEEVFDGRRRDRRVVHATVIGLPQPLECAQCVVPLDVGAIADRVEIGNCVLLDDEGIAGDRVIAVLDRDIVGPAVEIFAAYVGVQLLVIRSASPATSLDHLKPFKLSTALMAVHKDCYAPIGLIQQGGPRRRETINLISNEN